MKTSMNVRLASLALALVLSGCAAVSHVASGEAVVGNRLALKLDTAWNQFEHGMSTSTPTWTVEGITVDALQFYVGIQDGAPITRVQGNSDGKKPLTFRASMQPQDVVALYEALLTRDGSSFQLDKLEPTQFLGGPGFRFEYALIRKTDDVPLRGMAVGTVRNGELFVIQYSAPRLVFFPRYQPRVEALIRSASLKG